MQLRRKIHLSLAALLALLAATGGAMVHTARELHALNLELLDDAPSVDAAEEVELEIQRVARLEGLEGTPAASDAPSASARRLHEALSALDEIDARAHSVAERRLTQTLRADLAAIDPSHPSQTSIEAAAADAERLTELNRQELADATTASAALSHEAMTTAALLLVVGIFVGTLVVAMSWRSLSAPLARILEAVKRIEGGDTDLRLGLKGNDELARLSGALDHMLDVAERREQDKAAFVAGIAHDVRTPLTTMGLAVESLRGSLHDERALSRAALLERQIARLDRLLSELQEVARVAAGTSTPNARPIALDGVAGEAFALFRDSSPAHRFELEAERAVVHADPDLLMRVLVNLLSNAVKYSPGGGRIAVRVRADGKFAEVSVRDEGVGIEESARSRIFERFARVDPSSDVPGTGLGLYLARRIVRSFGGELDFESRRNEGSRFWVRLPRVDDARLEAMPPKSLH